MKRNKTQEKLHFRRRCKRYEQSDELFDFCMEQYKLHKHLSGKEVAELFKQYRVYEYILSCFDALHTTGTEYAMDDIDMYIDARIAAAKQ